MKVKLGKPVTVVSNLQLCRKTVETLLLVFLIWWKKTYLVSEVKQEPAYVKKIANPEGEEESLRERHIAKLLQNTKFSHLSLLQASELVDTMLRFTALAYDMVNYQNNKAKTLSY